MMKVIRKLPGAAFFICRASHSQAQSGQPPGIVALGPSLGQVCQLIPMLVKNIQEQEILILRSMVEILEDRRRGRAKL